MWLRTEAGEEGVEAYEWCARRVGEVVRIGVRSVRLRVGLGPAHHGRRTVVRGRLSPSSTSSPLPHLCPALPPFLDSSPLPLLSASLLPCHLSPLHPPRVYYEPRAEEADGRSHPRHCHTSTPLHCSPHTAELYTAQTTTQPPLPLPSLCPSSPTSVSALAVADAPQLRSPLSISLSPVLPSMPALGGLLGSEGQSGSFPWPLVPLLLPPSSSTSAFPSLPVLLSLSPSALLCVLLLFAAASALRFASPRLLHRVVCWVLDVLSWQLRVLWSCVCVWRWVCESVHPHPVYLLSVSVFRAPPAWRVSSERFRAIAGGNFRLPPATVDFCSRVLAHSGLGEHTAFPRHSHHTQRTHAHTRTHCTTGHTRLLLILRVLCVRSSRHLRRSAPHWSVGRAR